MTLPIACLIEDNIDLSIIFSKALSAAEFEVMAFLTGGEALEAMETKRPDLIVLDLNLPDMPGQLVLEQLRASHVLKDVDVVIASADHILADRLRDDATLVLVKPISYTQLRDLSSRLRSKYTA